MKFNLLFDKKNQVYAKNSHIKFATLILGLWPILAMFCHSSDLPNG